MKSSRRTRASNLKTTTGKNFVFGSLGLDIKAKSNTDNIKKCHCGFFQIIEKTLEELHRRPHTETRRVLLPVQASLLLSGSQSFLVPEATVSDSTFTTIVWFSHKFSHAAHLPKVFQREAILPPVIEDANSHGLSENLMLFGDWLWKCSAGRSDVTVSVRVTTYGRRKLKAVDCDPTTQVGTDLASHLSALPRFHFSPRSGENFTSTGLQASSKMDESCLASLWGVWE